MEHKKLFNNANENPLDHIVTDGGFCGIFRKIACIGDSLSSGEFQSLDENGHVDYHDFYEYSWGQYISRNIGSMVYNFSKGGMTAKQYVEEYADTKGFWDPDKACQAYIIALGVNDMCNNDIVVGSIDDINVKDYKNNKKTFAGYYGYIISRYKEIQPKAKFFLMTMPSDNNTHDDKFERKEAHYHLLKEIAELFDYSYLLDFKKYAPVYDDDFKKNFYLDSHMNPMGYMFTARMVESYIDYIIRHNMEDFSQTAFIGTPFYNVKAKW